LQNQIIHAANAAAPYVGRGSTEELERFFVNPSDSVLKAIEKIDSNSQGIVLVVTPDRHLIGTVTDGDVRRAILVGFDLNLPVKILLDGKSDANREPCTSPDGTSAEHILQLMNQRKIRHIPLLDVSGRVVRVCLFSELAIEKPCQPVQAVVLAGGFGKRLHPFTESVPKPMLKVGKEPLLERIVKQIRSAGIDQINISTHHKAEDITQHFGDGSDLGVQIRYVHEDTPLGTAGVLGLLPQSEDLTLVINGDILTRLNFRTMLAFHEKQEADMTIAVKQFDFEIAFGVLKTDGVLVTDLVEKPTYQFLVNAGIYVLGPSVREYVGTDCRTDMPDLIRRLIKLEKKVVSFPIREYWLDIGSPADYQKALNDIDEQEICAEAGMDIRTN